MEILTLGLLLIAAVLVSSVVDQIVPKVSLPLIQIGMGVIIALLAPAAIRIELNREREVLEKNMDDMIDFLDDGGRICVITFHSLEDRIVKNMFRKNEHPCTGPKDFPICVCGKKPEGRVVTRKPILPTEEELRENSRSRSAKLRVFERIRQES